MSYTICDCKTQKYDHDMWVASEHIETTLSLVNMGDIKNLFCYYTHIK